MRRRGEDEAESVMRCVDGFYYLKPLSQEKEPIELQEADTQMIKDYHLENFTKIFPEYREATDDVKDKSIRGSEHFVLRRQPSPDEVEQVFPPPGFYRFTRSLHFNGLKEVPVVGDQDHHVPLSDGYSVIQQDLDQFCESETVYRDLDLRYRRGALAYGPPGNGKTYNILRAARYAMREYDARVMFLSKEGPPLQNLLDFRPYFEDVLTLFVIEEITEFNVQHTESLLSFLDGQWSWDKSYSIATTNYPGKLPGNIVDRPGRFDRLIPMREPGAEDRRQFLRAFLDAEEFDESDVEATEGFSLAYLKEMVLRTRMYELSFQAVLEQFREQKRRIEEAFKDPRDHVGFLGSNGRAGTPGPQRRETR